MTELLLVRHGETESNRLRRFMGQSEVPMNSAGRQQAARVAARLQRGRVDVLRSSDLGRALETARIIGDAVGLEPRPVAALRELDVGNAVGMNRAELKSMCPELFGQNWMDTPFPGGESYAQMADRVGRFLRGLLANHGEQRLVVVTHGGTIRTAVAALTDIPLVQLIGLEVRNGSITLLSAASLTEVRLEVFNDVAHLEPSTDLPDRARTTTGA